MQTKIKNSKKISGYTLVELVIYISLLLLVSSLVVNTVVSFTKSYHTLAALRAVEHSANDSMERMTREIRGANTIDIANSTLGISPGVLTIVATLNGVSTTTKFYLQGGVLREDINGAYYGPLSIGSSTVTSLVFRSLTSPVSSAVKIDMTVQAVAGDVTKIKIYHSTIILRGQ